jgi:biotin--protein ligase
MRHPIELSSTAPIVFIQYLAAIAIVQGIHSYDKGYENLPVKLKWPNDVCEYSFKPESVPELTHALDVQDPSKPNEKSYIKIVGLMVNSSYSSGHYDVVVGIGINTSNPAPTTSLNDVLQAFSPKKLPPFTLEKLLARVLTSFEALYKSFCRTGFDKELQKLYYKHWLHTDQIVTLEMEGGARAKVLGITTDWGLLRVEQLGWEDRGTGKVWELQSDSNSFDFFKGL